MFLVLFAFVSVASAWVTWRHNPLYSTWSTLRFLGVVGLSIAGLAALIVAAVDVSSNLSEPVRIVAMVAVAIVGALGLIFVIHSLSTPKTTALPHSARLVHTHRQRVYAWAKRAVIAVLCAGALGAALPGNYGFVVLALGGFLLILAPVMLGAGYIVARDLDHALTALELNSWIHWRYSTEQWKEWTGVELERTKAPAPRKGHWKREWPAIPLMLGLTGAPVYLGADGSWQEKVTFVLGLWAILAILFICIVVANKKAAAERRSDLLHAPPDAYFGPDGLFCDGVFYQWMTVNQYLTSASVDERQPRSLLFRFDKIVANATAGQSVVPVEQHVPIPSGTEGDIARLQIELASTCPKARISMA